MSDERAAERLTGYSDAVVAIASTLLVLPLVDSALEVREGNLGEVLTDHRYELLAFVLSFVVISRLWVTHHRMFSALLATNPALVWANMAWLLGIVFLPFPTQVVASLGAHDRAASALYVGTLAATTAASLVVALILVRSPRLVEPGAPASFLPLVSTTVAFTVAWLLAVAVPAIGLYALLLVAVDQPVGNRIARLTARRGKRLRGESV